MNGLAQDADLPAIGVGLLESCQESEGGRFAAAGRSEEREELALMDVESEIVNGSDAAKML
jgi:hypothetical protein